YWWGDGVLPLGPSVFLEEIAGACRRGAGKVVHWAPPPEPGAENPALAEPASATWPAEPAGDRYQAVREAADMVRAAGAARSGRGAARRGPERRGPARPGRRGPDERDEIPHAARERGA